MTLHRVTLFYSYDVPCRDAVLMHLYASLIAWKESGRIKQKTLEKQRAWQDSNLRHSAPETVRTTPWDQRKSISMRFMHHHLYTIRQE